jgi:hypothetical protein
VVEIMMKTMNMKLNIQVDQKFKGKYLLFKLLNNQ